jgi:hypothetical protein
LTLAKKERKESSRELCKLAEWGLGLSEVKLAGRQEVEKQGLVNMAGS